MHIAFHKRSQTLIIFTTNLTRLQRIWTEGCDHEMVNINNIVFKQNINHFHPHFGVDLRCFLCLFINRKWYRKVFAHRNAKHWFDRNHRRYCRYFGFDFFIICAVVQSHKHRTDSRIINWSGNPSGMRAIIPTQLLRVCVHFGQEC